MRVYMFNFIIIFFFLHVSSCLKTLAPQATKKKTVTERKDKKKFGEDGLREDYRWKEDQSTGNGNSQKGEGSEIGRLWK